MTSASVDSAGVSEHSDVVSHDSVQGSPPVENKPVTGVKAAVKKKKHTPGIIYLSRIPPFMSAKKVRQLFSVFGEVDRIYLAPDERSPLNRRGGQTRIYAEGWVEFRRKKIAKKVAQMLNGNQVGGKKRSRWYDEVWSIKYLHRFRWTHLNERMAYEKAVREQKLRAEIAQAKRESTFHAANIQRATRRGRSGAVVPAVASDRTVDGKGEKNSGVSLEVAHRFRQNMTEEEILIRRKAIDVLLEEKRANYQPKRMSENRSLLKSLFTSGSR